MSKRPLRVTVVGWILAVTGGISIISLAVLIFFPTRYLPSPITPFYVISGFINPLIYLASGIGVLNRRNWGRWLYAIAAPILLLIGNFSTDPNPLQISGSIMGGIFYLVQLYLLFSPPALAFFRPLTPPATIQPEISSATGDEAGQRQQPKPTGVVRKILAVLAFSFVVVITGGITIGVFMLADNLYSRNVMLVFAFIPYLLASLFALVIGLVLWGWGRWRIVLGVMLCIVGAYVIMASGMLAGLKYLPELGMPTTGPSLPDLGLRPAYAGIVGVILIGLGILSILRQRHQDKLAVLLPNQ